MFIFAEASGQPPNLCVLLRLSCEESNLRAQFGHWENLPVGGQVSPGSWIIARKCSLFPRERLYSTMVSLYGRDAEDWSELMPCEARNMSAQGKAPVM